MTVSELIAELQKMPQDMTVYRGDKTWGEVSVDNVSIATVNDEKAVYPTREDEWKNPVRIDVVMVQ